MFIYSPAGNKRKKKKLLMKLKFVNRKRTELYTIKKDAPNIIYIYKIRVSYNRTHFTKKSTLLMISKNTIV